MNRIFNRIKQALSGGSASVTVNGRKVIHCGNVSGDMVISDKGVFVNGARIDDFASIKGPITVQIDGHVGSLKVQAGDVSVKGDVGELDSQAGDIEIGGNVEGDVKSSAGDIEIGGSVAGSVKSSCGDVTIGSR